MRGFRLDAVERRDVARFVGEVEHARLSVDDRKLVLRLTLVAAAGNEAA